MTQVEVHEGSVVDLVARIARERDLAAADGGRDREVDARRETAAERSLHAPRLLFPGAPHGGRRGR